MKSFRDQTVGQFKQAVLTSDKGTSTADAIACAATPLEFSLNSQVWNTLLEDPQIAAEFDKRISDEIDKREGLAAERGFEAGYTKGLEQGRADALVEVRAELDAIGKQIDYACDALLRDTKEFLHRHASELCTVLDFLMAKFLVEDAPVKLATVERWIKSMIKDLPGTQWSLSVDPEAHRSLEPYWHELSDRIGGVECELVLAPSLPRGDMRLKFGSGEVVFTRREELARLDKLLHKPSEQGVQT